MAELKARVSHLHATELQWTTLPDFIPNVAELVIYDKDATHDYLRFKIGDGDTPLINLPFFTTSTNLESIDGGEISSYAKKEDTSEEPEVAVLNE